MNKHDDICPHCGYCPHCGRSNQQAVPVVPVRPWPGGWWGIVPPYYVGDVPYNPYTTTITTTTGTAFVPDDGSVQVVQ